MKRILVVEDHPIMSEGTCQLIKKFLAEAVFIQVDTFWKSLQVAESSDLVENTVPLTTPFRGRLTTSQNSLTFGQLTYKKKDRMVNQNRIDLVSPK